MVRVLRRDVLRAARWRARPRDVIRADRSYGRSLPRCGSRRPELPEAAPGMLSAPSSARPASTGALPGIRWPLDLVRVFTHGRRTGTCVIARAWTHGQGACVATNGGARCRGRGTIKFVEMWRLHRVPG